MKSFLTPVLLTFWLCAQFVMEAQDDRSKVTTPPSTLDFSKDPCGNPMMENQLWEIVEGQVTKVLDGRTVALALRNTNQTVKVRLVGISLEPHGSYSDKAREQLRASVLNKDVEMLVSPRKWQKHPHHVVGTIHIRNGPDSDVGLVLLSSGLVRFKTAAPYEMAHYMQCQYRRAEQEAQAKALGLCGGL